MLVDLALKLTPQNYYDIALTEEGDFLMTQGLDTALIMSIFCEKRASFSEIPIPEKQRGWWGNLFNDIINYEQGSKLWLLYQAKNTQDNLNRGIAYLYDGFSWLIPDNFADRVEVTGDFGLGGFVFNIKTFRSQNVVGSFTYEIWQGMGLTNAN